ncbi:hypothetical protein J2D73_05480 [Acetobacter sacchari]|uniref:Uncharacterized protein n=1 Tax=Acetobacter sacchari TaxID=2661687 RepID=A0ABS3LTL8_9PROT|nr:hypothetical protein [Acetobacter sacchari]MBO1359247.1 hypothetical protein [Acetobacter sacchari]
MLKKILHRFKEIFSDGKISHITRLSKDEALLIAQNWIDPNTGSRIFTHETPMLIVELVYNKEKKAFWTAYQLVHDADLRLYIDDETGDVSVSGSDYIPMSKREYTQDN